MFLKRKIRWYQKRAAKWFGMAILKCPPARLQCDFVKDFVMIFHYCRTCRKYRFDRHFDLLSQSEHFFCGECGTKYGTRNVCGLSPFYLQECARIALELSKKEKGKKREELILLLRTMRIMATGLGKHMPHDREGKTSGELEFDATFSFSWGFLDYIASLKNET